MLETGESRSVDLRKIETGLSGVQFIFLIELIKLSDASRLDLQHEGPKFFFALEPVLSSGKPVVGTSCNRYLSQISISEPDSDCSRNSQTRAEVPIRRPVQPVKNIKWSSVPKRLFH